MSKFYGNYFAVFCLYILVFTAFAVPIALHAQTSNPVYETGKQYSFEDLKAIDSSTLANQNIAILLAGINTPKAGYAEIVSAAKELLEETLAGNTANCLISEIGSPPLNKTQVQVIRGMCKNINDLDLAEVLLTQGLAVISPSGLSDADSARYRAAENLAKNNKVGIWAATVAFVTKTEPADTAQQPKQSNRLTLISTPVLAAAFITILICLFLLTLYTNLGLKRLRRDLNSLQSTLKTRDQKFHERERFIIASALEGELNANRAKLDAFLLIYEEMLKALRDPTRKPKYQKAGDIIHESPSLSRGIYDANAEKAHLLGDELAKALQAIYARIASEPNFKTIEPNAPLDSVIALVENVIGNTQNLLEPMDSAIGILGIVLRRKT